MYSYCDFEQEKEDALVFSKYLVGLLHPAVFKSVEDLILSRLGPDYHSPFLERDNKYCSFLTRSTYNEMFSWPLITKGTVTDISSFLEKKKCLSVMSGKGGLEFILNDRGHDIIASDINDMSEEHAFAKSLCKDFCDSSKILPFMQMDARNAVIDVDHEVLLMSWPPYGKDIGFQTLDLALKTGTRYLIYIGEGYDGCCATNEFFELLAKCTKDIEHCVELKNFPKIWDACSIHESKYPKREPVKFRSSLLNNKIRNFVANSGTKSTKKLKKLVKKSFGISLTKKHINHILSLE